MVPPRTGGAGSWVLNPRANKKKENFYGNYGSKNIEIQTKPLSYPFRQCYQNYRYYIDGHGSSASNVYKSGSALLAQLVRPSGGGHVLIPLRRGLLFYPEQKTVYITAFGGVLLHVYNEYGI
jgi:hypothetical protein